MQIYHFSNEKTIHINEGHKRMKVNATDTHKIVHLEWSNKMEKVCSWFINVWIQTSLRMLLKKIWEQNWLIPHPLGFDDNIVFEKQFRILTYVQVCRNIIIKNKWRYTWGMWRLSPLFRFKTFSFFTFLIFTKKKKKTKNMV